MPSMQPHFKMIILLTPIRKLSSSRMRARPAASSALLLLMLRISVANNHNLAFSFNDLALIADRLH